MTIRPCPCGKLDQLRRGRCHACYERDRRAGRIESLVPTVGVRDHIVLLRVNGWRYREIARAAGIDRSQVAWIAARGREKITAKTARRICGIHPADHARHMRFGWDTRRGIDARRQQAIQAERSQVPITSPGRWIDDALCAQVDSELFFPAKGGDNRAPKRVCRGCEVRDQCLDFAIENDIRHGIFGGLSIRERDRIRRTRRQESPITA